MMMLISYFNSCSGSIVAHDLGNIVHIQNYDNTQNFSQC